MECCVEVILREPKTQESHDRGKREISTGIPKTKLMQRQRPLACGESQGYDGHVAGLRQGAPTGCSLRLFRRLAGIHTNHYVSTRVVSWKRTVIVAEVTRPQWEKTIPKFRLSPGRANTRKTLERISVPGLRQDTSFRSPPMRNPGGLPLS